jgi:hypothetical protein
MNVLQGYARLPFYLRVSPKLTAKVRKNDAYSIGDPIIIKRIEKGWGDTGKGWALMLWISLDDLVEIPDNSPPPFTPTDFTCPLLPPFVTPQDGKIIQFRSDKELKEWDYKSRVVGKNYKFGALPSTIHLDGKPDYIPLTEPWQRLAFELIKWQDNGRNTHENLLEAYKSVYLDRRALTDRHAWDTPNNGFSGYHDYVLGTNVKAKDVAQLRLAMSGNIARALTRGKKITFAAFATSQPCPRIENIWGDHTKIWWATESDRPGWFRGGRIDFTGYWPQLGKYGVPFLNISPDGLNYVRSDKIRWLENNIEFSPYDS